ncbi:dTDP-4-dehydrorhamnose 3,5-epimerase [Microvirga roseola]|uniref:dTDP-4-dehydrorhamnose 3,5-epimerase n=1 Tax=Microvirga roseola TaxID=2883126 RepID=UPI001E647FED|nr:dTDP-4-dehydrorhamnose 3,5-epimerase [Microvirga roseola]
MFFERTEIPGVYIVELEKREDERGFFARGWCQREFQQMGLPEHIAQINISYNRYKHTLRGFHYQVAPYQEDKLLRCTRGAIYDVLLDLRPDSPTYKQHITIELTARNYRSLLVPKGCANAFLTLEDETEVTYLVSEFYTPEAERGVRWNDPTFGITWPVSEPAVISDKDRSWPDFAA